MGDRVLSPLRRGSLLVCLAMVGCSAGSPSAPPLPGVYGPKDACARVPFEGTIAPSGWEWCIDAVTVSEAGELDFLASWTGYGTGFERVEKGADAGNHNMYLVDDRGRRYDHHDTTDAARFGGALTSGRRRLQGSFLFRGQNPEASRFEFRDDDQHVSVQVALEPERRLALEERQAIAEQIRSARSIDIRYAWRGLGKGRDEAWRLTRAGGALSGDAEVPEGVARHFFDLLASAPITRGEYVPRVTHTDDYARLSIELDEAITFFTESQGTGHVPWGVRSGGKALVVPSDHPAAAFGTLRPFLEAEPGAGYAATDPRVDQLRLAAQTGDLETLRSLIADGVDVNGAAAYDGETPLGGAVLGKQPDAVTILVAAGANPELETPRGRPLDLAIGMGAARVVKALIDAGSVPSPGTRGRAALAAAVSSGQMERVQALLGAGLEFDVGSLLNAAASEGLLDVARQLLAGGVSPDAGDDTGVTPLMSAARHGHAEMLQLLLEAGAQVNAQDGSGWTALHRAASNGYPDVVERLLRAGAAPNARAKDGATPLFTTTVPAVAKALIGSGADPNARSERAAVLHAVATSGGGRTYSATRHRYGPPSEPAATLRLLVQAGADVNVRDGRGRTPLMAVVNPIRSDAVELLETLLTLGADPNLVDAEGLTALRLAVDAYGPGMDGQRSPDLVHRLLEAGAIDHPGSDGRTSLDVAIEKNAGPLVILLSAKD